MKHNLKPFFALVTFALLATSYVQSDTEEKFIIALKTGALELAQTDISSLAVGGSQTIKTDSGKVIDILRTSDGVEIYVDGELLDVSFIRDGLHEDGLHQHHMMIKHTEIICDSDEECGENLFIFASDHTDVAGWVTEDGENIVIHKEIELICADVDEGISCSDHMAWMSDGENIDLAELHALHMQGEREDYKVIVIKKHLVVED